MKCVSLWQPWATAVAIGVKEYETRSWSTNHRGLLAIHAAKRRPQPAELERLPAEFFARLHAAGYRGVADLPGGAIVAVVNLEAVFETNSTGLPPFPVFGPGGTGLEAQLGDFRPGRFAWLLENVRRLERPVPWRGRQGLFDVPAELSAHEPPHLEDGRLVLPLPAVAGAELAGLRALGLDTSPGGGHDSSRRP